MRKLAIVMTLILTGCETLPGIGGAAGSAVPLSSNEARRRDAGDSWTFDIEQVATSTSGGGDTWHGTQRQFILNSTDAKYGAVVVTVTTGQITADGKPGVQQVISNQSIGVREPSGAIRVVAVSANGATSYVASPSDGVPVDPKRTFDVGDTFTYGNVVFDEGTEISGSKIITAIETITVPLGTFQAYREEFTEVIKLNSGESVSRTGTMWTVPQIGAPIKTTAIEDRISNNGAIEKGVFQNTYVMTSTTVAY